MCNRQFSVLNPQFMIRFQKDYLKELRMKSVDFVDSSFLRTRFTDILMIGFHLGT